MRNAGLEETQAGIKISGRNIDNLRYADDTTLMAEREEELKTRGTTRISGSLSCGAREVKSPCAWRGGPRHGSRVTGGD